MHDEMVWPIITAIAAAVSEDPLLMLVALAFSCALNVSLWRKKCPEAAFVEQLRVAVGDCHEYRETDRAAMEEMRREIAEMRMHIVRLEQDLAVAKAEAESAKGTLEYLKSGIDRREASA